MEEVHRTTTILLVKQFLRLSAYGSKLFTTLPDPEYWSRLAEYSPSPNSQVQRIMCPSMRTLPPGE